jgi:GR25 family glycosyltransferase involved in LPS biosynthesis
MSQDSASDSWSFFDSIYCISLKDRPDRHAQAAAQFALVGLTGRVQFLLADRHATDAEQGIYESHRACIRQGLAEGSQRILIFEDDVIFERFSPNRVDAAVSYLRQQPDWKILFLGCLASKSLATQSPAVRKVDYRCLAHAYALNRAFAEQLEQKPWSGIPFDCMLRCSDGLFACHPSFAFQSDMPSDNLRHRKLDRFRRICGGLRRIQKVNEWYICHKAAFIALHAAIIVAILWLIMLHKS